MCGITGIFNLAGEPVSRVFLKNMTEVISHRGPDGEGIYVDRFLGIGHRRLAVIDLSPNGHQPMLSPDNNYALTYNGEIYNFQEIRAELQSLGHLFNSKTDSEVILHAFVEWGPDCVKHFNGMFAFAIWNKQEQKLFLARDRYGIKPLYYAFCDKLFLFASEQKAILEHPAVKREIDLEALFEYFTFQNIFTNKTLLKSIKLFPPATHASISLGSNQQYLAMQTYWDYDFREPDVHATEEEYTQELDRLFRQAVNRQLVSDVDVGAYLSGGMDSGSLTAIAALQIPYIKSFTCGFDLRSASGLELAFDEREKAEYMSYLFKTEHYEMVLKAGDMERCLPKMAWHLEEPRVGQCYPNYYISQLASKFVKVVLSGVGGDELFAGYPWRYYRAVSNKDFEDYIDKYYSYWQRLIGNTHLRKIFKPVWGQVQDVCTRDIFREVFKTNDNIPTAPADYINHSLYFEAKTFMHGLLIVEDKLSMAHGLETRVPFLDNDLVDFAMQVPVNMKLGKLNEVVRIDENEPFKEKKYFQKTRDGKLLLRKVMNNYIPDQITTGIKQGFSAPDASWFKGESITYLKDKLFNNHSLIYDFFDQKTIESLINDHVHGKVNRRLFVWSLLNFEEWCQQYLKK